MTGEQLGRELGEAAVRRALGSLGRGPTKTAPTWTPGCMTAEEYADWRTGTAQDGIYASARPCDACPIEWAAAERSAGRCNLPGVLDLDGNDPDLDSDDPLVRRRAQYRQHNRRRAAS